MKKLLSLSLALMMCMCFVIPASAAEMETATTEAMRAVEIRAEMDSAEEILGGPCRLESQEIQETGDYVVETRLYVLDEENELNKAALQSERGISECGGVSSHVWRRIGEKDWSIKVLFAAFFAYNGTTAMCDETDYDLWAIRADGSEISTNFNPKPTFKDGTTATAKCSYARDEPGTDSDTIIWGTLKVTCTKDGKVGIESEVEHSYYG